MGNNFEWVLNSIILYVGNKDTTAVNNGSEERLIVIDL